MTTTTARPLGEMPPAAPPGEPGAGTDAPLTGFEALSWKLDSRAGLRSDFANVTVLSRAPDPEGVRERVTAVVDALPQLRRRVDARPWSLGPPTWRDDPSFDVTDHLGTVRCPSPGTLAQLLDLAENLTAAPFPPDRPLWRVTLVDGLAGGRTALVQHMHHAVTDGAGGVRALAILLGTDRGGPAAPPPASDRPAASGGVPFLSALGRLAGTCAGTTSPRLDPSAALGFVRDQLLVGRRPASALIAERCPSQRRFGAHSLPLDRVRRAARALGGSRNDLLVAGVAGAVHGYHARLDEPCRALRMAVPFLRRSGRRRVGGNDVTVATFAIPPGIGSATERFRVVREHLVRLTGDPALGLSDLGLELLGTLPARVVVNLAAAHNGAVDAVASGVPGMRSQGALGGAIVEASYPFGPRVGAALTVTALRCHDHLDLGLNVDPAAIADPDLLLTCVVDAFEALLGAGDAGSGNPAAGT